MPHQLLYSPASPYSSKVRMGAAHAGIALELVPVQTTDSPTALLAANPLGKIPVLLPAGGAPVHDSRAITRFLDRECGGRLFPADARQRTEAEVMEALGDGLCDALIAHVYERRFRPAELVHQAWLEKQWARALRGLESRAWRLSELDDVHAGSIALRAALGYLALRFAGQWEARCPQAVAWAAEFDRRHPALADCLPR